MSAVSEVIDRRTHHTKGQVMDAKTEARRRRNAADLLDQVAEELQPLSVGAAKQYQLNAEANRSIANKLDPPQPEWQDGDLVLGANSTLWFYECGLWNSPSFTDMRSTDSLIAVYGPIRKVRIADPAKQEVVVSLEGIDREDLDGWAWQEESSYSAPARRTAIRAAKAAREQLGKKEH